MVKAGEFALALKYGLGTALVAVAAAAIGAQWATTGFG